MVTDNNKLLLNQVRWKAGLVAGIAALFASGFFYWQFLESQPGVRRVPLPAAELQAAEGFGVCWRVPESLRSTRWHRTGVRLWEDEYALPFRVDSKGRVEQEGRGRFFVDREWLWFSASDNSRPSTNGKQYQLEVSQPKYQGAIIAAGLLAGVILLWTVFLPWRLWLSSSMVIRLGSGRYLVSNRKMLGAGCCLLAFFFLLLPFAPWKIHRRMSIPAETLLQRPEGQFCYSLPRWIRRDAFRIALVSLSENQQPLRQVSHQVMRSESAMGGFNCDQDYLQFRATDASNPSVNGRAYHLRVAIFSPQLVTLIMLALGGLGLFLLIQLPYPARKYFALAAGQKSCWYGLLLIASLAKLYVISGDDMVAAEADSYSYASAATQTFWGATSPNLPTHPSFFPLLAGTMARFGVPWRFALEILYLGACYFLAVSIKSLMQTRFIALLTFFLTVWHPWTFNGFRSFMSDPLVLVLLMGLLAAMIRVISQPANQWRWPSFFLIGILLFLWEWSRHEDLLIYAGYAYFAVLALLVAKLSERAYKENRWPIAALLVLPVIMVFMLSGLVKWTHYCRFGVYAKSLIHAPGLTALMKALYRIKPDQEIRYAPVTRQSLQAACRVSSSLKPYETNLLDPQSINTRIGEYYTKIPGEFGPWLNWLLPSSIPASTGVANEIMLEAAGEINQALKSGELPVRHAFFPLDPNWHHWLRELLPSFLSRLKEGFSMVPADEPQGTYHKPLLQKVFNEAARRRAANIYPRMLLGQGQVSAPSGAIDSVAVTDQDGKLLGASLLFSNWWDQALTFDIQANLEVQPTGYQLAFFQGGRLQQAIQLTPEASFKTNIPGTDNQITGQTSLSWIEPDPLVRRQKCEVFLSRYYGWILLWSVFIVSGMMFLTASWGRTQLLAVTACWLLVTGWIMARAALYALIEVNLGWKAGRYMQCLAPVSMVALILMAIAVGAFLRGFCWPPLMPSEPKISGSRGRRNEVLAGPEK